MKNLLNLLTVFLFLSTTTFAQKIDQQFFNDADAFFKDQVKNSLVEYKGLKGNTELAALIQTVENADLSGVSDATKKAFYINAYNLHVINEAAKLYPTNSVQEGGGFFDRNKVKTAGEMATLNNLEKNQLLKQFGDGRLHFVLVCGALGCPPITDFAYLPAKLDEQLDQQTKLALDNPAFLKVDRNNLELSQIFKWYPEDFGGSKRNIISFINKHRTNTVPSTARITYYDYDWSLNDASVVAAAATGNNGGNNTTRYIVSSTIPKGSVELKIFNNLYTQRTGSQENLTDRATFFTTSVSALYGLSSRFNIGLNSRIRRVRNDLLPSSALRVFGNSDGPSVSSRAGLTAIGPQIRYAPVEAWSNFSIQSAFLFAVGDDLTGSQGTGPFIDWDGATWNTQIFNDFPIGNSFSLFTELDVLLEDLGGINRWSTPVTLIFSYNPNKKTTIYALGGYSPFWQDNFDYFLQGGTGLKYQFTPDIEIELLVTDFTNRFLKDTGGQAATFNLGLRFNL